VIWLWANAWWWVPLLVLALASLHPAGWALLRRVPARVWLPVLAVALLGLSFQAGRWYERSQVEKKAAAADVKAGETVTKSKARAEKVRKAITEETEDAVAEVEAAVAALPDTCPPLPDGVRDSVQRQVQAARDGVPEPARGRDP
jgi:hypothetical protein